MSPACSQSILRFRTPLDRDVYQIIKKIEASHDGAKPFNRSVPAIYEAIKRSNSSLGRQKKRPLEDAIDRALQILNQEQQESDDSEAAIDQPEPPKAADDRFLLNHQLTKLWKMDQNPRASGEPSASKRRRVQLNGHDDNEQGAEIVVNGSDSAGATALATFKHDRSKTKAPQKTTRHIVEQPGQCKPVAGYDALYSKLMEHAWMLLQAPDRFNRNTRLLHRGILLSGPSGVGKKTLARNMATDLSVPLISLIQCFFDPERIDKNLSEAFDTAISLAPSIIFIEDIDRFMPRSSPSESPSRAAYRFAGQLERIHPNIGPQVPVLVLATTSRVADVDPDVLKTGRIDVTVEMGIPDRAARRDILEVLTEGLHLADDVDFDEIAKVTHGYVGSDLAEIATRASSKAFLRMCRSADPEGAMFKLHTQRRKKGGLGAHEDFFKKPITRSPLPSPETMEDFMTAIKDFTPSLRKEGFTAIPSVIWEQVGALEKARKQLQTSIIGPIQNPELYQNFGLTRPVGVLLWGPPGCGKTLIAQAVANEAQASFIAINGPELLNKYVGESERAVRELFQRARCSTPCILFFDEIDSIVPSRSNASTESGARVVNALLTELDGVKDRTGIYVIGTTNRPEMIDEAILREGRLSIHLLIDLPTAEERVDILRTIYRTRHEGASDETLDRLGAVALDDRCTNFSGADLDGLHTKAAEHALENYLAGGRQGPRIIADVDWQFALANSRASIKDAASYKSRAAQ